MTITIEISNTDNPGGRKATVLRHDRVEANGEIVTNTSEVAKLGGGETATVYIHTGMSVTAEERAEDDNG